MHSNIVPPRMPVLPHWPYQQRELLDSMMPDSRPWRLPASFILHLSLYFIYFVFTFCSSLKATSMTLQALCLELKQSILIQGRWKNPQTFIRAVRGTSDPGQTLSVSWVRVCRLYSAVICGWHWAGTETSHYILISSLGHNLKIVKNQERTQ